MTALKRLLLLNPVVNFISNVGLRLRAAQVELVWPDDNLVTDDPRQLQCHGEGYKRTVECRGEIGGGNPRGSDS